MEAKNTTSSSQINNPKVNNTNNSEINNATNDSDVNKAANSPEDSDAILDTAAVFTGVISGFCITIILGLTFCHCQAYINNTENIFLPISCYIALALNALIITFLAIKPSFIPAHSKYAKRYYLYFVFGLLFLGTMTFTPIAICTWFISVLISSDDNNVVTSIFSYFFTVALFLLLYFLIRRHHFKKVRSLKSISESPEPPTRIIHS